MRWPRSAASVRRSEKLDAALTRAPTVSMRSTIAAWALAACDRRDEALASWEKRSRSTRPHRSDALALLTITMVLELYQEALAASPRSRKDPRRFESLRQSRLGLATLKLRGSAALYDMVVPSTRIPDIMINRGNSLSKFKNFDRTLVNVP